MDVIVYGDSDKVVSKGNCIWATAWDKYRLTYAPNEYKSACTP